MFYISVFISVGTGDYSVWRSRFKDCQKTSISNKPIVDGSFVPGPPPSWAHTHARHLPRNHGSGAGTVSGQGGQRFLEKIRREAPKKKFAHPDFQFAHAGFNSMGGQRPSCDYLNKS